MTARAVPTEWTDWAHDRCAALIRNVEGFIHGKTSVVRDAVICLLAEGHLLIEDVPGVAKTSLAKAIASSISGSMKRIQFTPDLLPSDVIGVQTWDTREEKFQFRKGPVFAHIVVADEINRASPKTQSALLEAMAEHQVTVDGKLYPLPQPNVVIATQNPIDLQGTYALPEAQLDRFMMLLRVGYPNTEHEMHIVRDAVARRLPHQLQPVITIDDVRKMIDIARSVEVTSSIQRYIVTLVANTRTVKHVRLGASPRASNALAVASQARAVVYEGRSFVTADDVKAVARSVLSHRLLLTSEAAVQGHTAEDIIDEIMVSVAVPQGPPGG